MAERFFIVAVYRLRWEKSFDKAGLNVLLIIHGDNYPEKWPFDKIDCPDVAGLKLLVASWICMKGCGINVPGVKKRIHVLLLEMAYFGKIRILYNIVLKSCGAHNFELTACTRSTALIF